MRCYEITTTVGLFENGMSDDVEIVYDLSLTEFSER
jgi:hypothetical protein